MNKLRPIPKNGRLAITAPASKVDASRLKKGVKRLEDKGYKVIVGDTCTSSYHYLSAPDNQRADELMQFFVDPSIDGIICARGGYGTIRLLELLDYDQIAAARKLIMGYSDITALSWAITHKCDIPTINGSMIASDFGDTNADNLSIEQAFDILKTGIVDIQWKTAYKKSFRVNGPLYAGTLSVLHLLLGTNFSPNLSESIFMIEDIGEPTRKIDGYLQHMWLSGYLKEVQAMLVGDFGNRIVVDEANYPIDMIFSSFRKDISYPIIDNVPFGHVNYKRSFPIGIPCTLEANDGMARLFNTESIFEG